MSPEREIFNYWVSRMRKGPLAKLTTGRRDKIKTRLKEGYTMDDIKMAIDGCAKSPYHMGVNEQNHVYDALELICRSGENLERFISYNTKVTPVRSGSTRTRDVSIEEQLTDTSWANGYKVKR